MIIKKIGGYFGLETLSGREYYSKLTAVNTARNALAYILRSRKIKKLYLPFFLCDSVFKVCIREKVDVSFYRIGKDFRPLLKKRVEDDEYLYIVNIYGQISNIEVKELQVQYGNIILDNVQAFFQRPEPGIDTVYSCRKFFGVPDGAYISTTAHLEEPLPEDISGGRLAHLLGRFETGRASEYYEQFKANDRAFQDLELRTMSKLTHNLLGAVDYETVRRKREENYAVLEKRLGVVNQLMLTVPAGPYAYPFYCEDGMEVKRCLAKKGIYIPTLWPNVLSQNGTLEKEYAENILPLPCDQRYGEKDMESILCALSDFVDGI